MSESLHCISLGAGVQSSTMALMAKHGEITPMPEAAIFADTGDEPKSVYEWLRWLETELPFRVVRVSVGVLSLAAMTLRQSKKDTFYMKPGLPVFFEGAGMGSRQCTSDFKIVPIQRYINLIRGNRSVRQWIGISTDEAHRMKDAQKPWLTNGYPLIDAGMSRSDCLRWMEAHGYPKPPRSSCVYCPFHSDAEWLRLKNDEPAEFERAVKFERIYQVASEKAFKSRPFLHVSRKPLSEVEFSSSDNQLNLFGNECEGMCGV